jgi:protein required for attachment to host cells
MKKQITWILVADGKRGMIYSHDGPGQGIVAVPGMKFETELHASRDIVSDKPGRVQESGYSARHSVERVDYHRLEKAHFAQELAKRLDAALEEGKCQRLVLVAPPRALGDLRQALAPKSRSAVTGELDKDLTQAKLPDIAKHLEAVLAV